MIKQTPCAAFGYVILKNEIDAGEILNDELFKNGKYQISDSRPNDLGKYGDVGSGYTWLYTKGRLKHTNIYTDENQVRGPGWCNLVDTVESGLYSVEIIEPMVTFCVSPVGNKDKLPKIPKMEYFHLAKDSTTILVKGTKLFLADGTMTSGTTVLTGTRQVSALSGDVSVTATSDCYGFLM
jgi:hypothetical protein